MSMRCMESKSRFTSGLRGLYEGIFIDALTLVSGWVERVYILAYKYVKDRQSRKRAELDHLSRPGDLSSKTLAGRGSARVIICRDAGNAAGCSFDNAQRDEMAMGMLWWNGRWLCGSECPIFLVQEQRAWAGVDGYKTCGKGILPTLPRETASK